MKPHQKLEAWKRSIKLTLDIYSITDSFPRHEQFSMTSQLRRAAVSIAINIAEGAARNSTKEFLHFLFIARGSLSEVDTLLLISKELQYISDVLYGNLINVLESISMVLDGLIKFLKSKLI